MVFILDIGNVLIDFKPRVFLKRLFANQAVIDKMYDTVFKSHEWVLLDEGSITLKEACEAFCAREPDFRTCIERTMERLPDMLTPISGTIDILPGIKESGHSLYYLSNYHKELSLYIQAKYQFFNHFNGGVFSCDAHMLKPSPGIYRYFLDKYTLSACDCIFFDDMDENVAAARDAGIKSVLFTGAEDIASFL